MKKTNRTIQNKPTANQVSFLDKIPYAPAIIFALTTLIFFWGQLTGASFFWEDFTEYVYPAQSFAATEFAKNGIPFWNPYTFNGMPFLADLQTGFFYPLNRLLNLFVTGENLPVWAVQFVIIIHFFIAQLSAFFLARKFGISSSASLLTAVSYSFSMLLVCHVFHPMIVYHLAWFPLVLAFFKMAIENRNYSYGIGAGLILGMSMLSGHPQLTLYEAFALFVFYIYFLISNKKENAINFNSILAGLVPFIVAISMFAVQLLPSQELASLSQRAETGYEKATEGSLSWGHIFTAVAPNAYGKVSGADERNLTYYFAYPGANAQRHFYWETAFYFGIPALFLSLFMIINYYKDRRVLFLFLFGLFGFLFALGSNFFIFDIFYQLPFFGTFRNPTRMMFLTALCFSILAGMGVDRIAKNKDVKFSSLLIAFAILLIPSILLVSGGAASLLNTPEQLLGDIKSAGGISVLFLVLSLGLTLVLKQGFFSASVVGASLAMIAFFDLYLAGGDFNANPRNPIDSYAISDGMRDAFQYKSPDNLFRVNSRMYQPSYMAMNRNQGMIDRIMLVEGYNPLILQRVLPPLPSREAVNDIYNVKFEIGIDKRTNQPQFYERENRFPRAWLAYNAVICDEEQVKKYMNEETFDLRNTVLLEKVPYSKYSETGTNKPDDAVIECVEYSSNYMKFKVTSSKPAFACFSEIYYPAWKAYQNGKEKEVFLADYCFRAVEVDPGEHIIEMRYESDKFTLGATVSFLSVLLSGLSLVWLSRKRLFSKS